jgi:hypothetical protein
MRSPFRYAIFEAVCACSVAAAVVAFAGCGSDAHHTDGGAHMDADFAICQDTPAVTYEQGMMVTSTAGTYVATLVSAVTASNPSIQGPEVAKDNVWVVAVTDAASGMPADVMLTAQRPTMPLHGHGSPDTPVVTPGDPGTFTITMLNFFMAGYWEFKLDLQPATGAADRVTFAICVPS